MHKAEYILFAISILLFGQIMKFERNLDQLDKKFQKSPDKTDSGSTRLKVNPEQPFSKPLQKKKGRKAIGNYTYHEQHIIGWGYTSKVYKGRTLDKSEPTLHVAIKKIPLTNLDNLHIGLLQNEVRIVRKLSHPNIVTVYDVLYTKKNCYIVMELCQGGCLEKYLKKMEKDEERIKIMRDVCMAFHYLVEEGVVHRDIKPGNILKGKNGDWKLADFGFATEISQALKDDKISVGTPIYMAPQSLSIRKYSYKSDIFSIGVVFHQVINKGKLLWFQKSKKKILEAIMDYDFNQMDVPKPFSRSFLLKMLQPNPQKRISPEMLSVANLQQSKILNCGYESQHQQMLNERENPQQISYEAILRKEEVHELLSSIQAILKDDKVLDIDQIGLELYSTLKIQKQALQLELNATFSHTIHSKKHNRSYSKQDFTSTRTKYTIAKVTNPYTLQFLTYLVGLVEQTIGKVPDYKSSFSLKNSDSIKLCYQKVNGKYIFSPKVGNGKFSNTPNINSGNINSGNSNSGGISPRFFPDLNQQKSSLRDHLLVCKGHLQTLILAYDRIDVPCLGSPPDLRKVFSENYFKGNMF